jgi:hypothetical protein
MAGEGDAAVQSEGDILSEALETFDRGMGNQGAPGETDAGGSQGEETAGGMQGAGTQGKETSGRGTAQGAGSQPAAAGNRSGTGGTGTSTASRGARTGSGTGAASSNTGSGSGGYRTDRERVAELDRELDGQMGAFDGMLLEERALILASGETGDDAGDYDEEGSGGGGGEEDEGSGSGGDLAGAGQGEQDSEGAPPLLTRGGSGGGGGMPDAKGGGNRQGDYEQVAMAGPVPQDIPSADGDDVVARQLREAAMREPDPVLREKLWNEYRRYKGLPVKQ